MSDNTHPTIEYVANKYTLGDIYLAYMSLDDADDEYGDDILDLCRLAPDTLETRKKVLGFVYMEGEEYLEELKSSLYAGVHLGD